MSNEHGKQKKNTAIGIGKLYSLTGKQIFLLVVMGLVFWYIGATCVRMGSEIGAFGSKTSILSYAAGFLIGWVTVIILKIIAKLKPNQIIPGCCIGGAVATFCDGIAITWTPWLYGTDPLQISLGAAWILWNIFTLFGAAILVAYRLESK